MRPIARIPPNELDALDADEVIDVRSPAEFAADHLLGAVNLPVLDDAQRALVGTVYKQRSPFEARRLGAGLVAENIALHLRQHLSQKPADFRPLIYCWRGGDRSGAMATVLDSVGWRPTLLDGGYRSYRKHVVAALAELPARGFTFRIIAGLTGSGKTRLLDRLRVAGAQVIDLEGLAEHRGSALGESLSAEQPTQKAFENLLYQALRGFEPGRPVYLESESSRVGLLQVPSPLWSLMREAAVFELEVPRPARARFLVEDYPHFVSDRSLLEEKLEKVKPLQPAGRYNEWCALLDSGDWGAFVESILEHHYDPAYRRSRKKTFRPVEKVFELSEVSDAELDRIASKVLELERE